MNKSYFLKIVLVCVLLFQFVNKASAQYAVGGTASPNLVKSIYWLTWNKGDVVHGNKLVDSPPLATADNIIDGDYEWEFSPTVHIHAKIEHLNITAPGTPPFLMRSYTPGNWSGDGLDVLYNGNGIITPKDGANLEATNSRGVAGSALATPNGGLVTFDITLTLLIKASNGSWNSVPYPGMVIADAEAIAFQNGSDLSTQEYFGGTTNSTTTKWQLLNLRVDPLKNPANQAHYVMDIQNSGKDFKIYADDAAGHDPGVQAVMFAKGATALTNVFMKGYGVTATAIGFVIPFDLGDAPLTYGKPQAYINDFDETQHLPGDQLDISLTGYAADPNNFATLTPKAKVFMGPSSIVTDKVDADGEYPTIANALGDDNTDHNDENGVVPYTTLGSPLTGIKVNRSTDITIPITSVTNPEASAATLYGWIDFNHDGIFSPNEEAQATVPANTTNNTTIQLTFPKTSFGSIIKAGDTYARFRITTTAITDDDGTTPEDDRSTISTGDGEIEDYFLNIAGVTVSGNVAKDADGLANGISTATPVSTIGSNALYAYLLDKGTGNILKQSPVTGGAYSFTNVDNGAYSVAISSVAPVAPGNTTSIADLAPALPSGWVASVDGFGTNNAANTAVPAVIADGTPDLQVDVTIPSGGVDVTGINFGLDQNPVAVDVSVSTNTNVAVSSVLPSSDTDPDGNTTIDAASITIEDPSVLNTFGTAGFTTSEGTYALDATTGKITFTPASTFTGTTSGIRYKVKDTFGAESLTPGNFTVAVSLGGVADTYTTKMNVAILNPVKTNDGDAANTVAPDPVAAVTPTSGAHGTAVVDPLTNIITYTPTTGFIGVDTYTYTLTKGSDVSAAVNVTVTVLPNGADDNVNTVQDQLVNTLVNGNDVTTIDPTVSGESIAILTGPTHGTAVINANLKSVDYTPSSGYIGTDLYTYTITKGGQTSAAITVNVTVKPQGSTDNISTTQDQLINKKVNTNDLTQIDPTVSGESIAVLGAASHGTAVLNGDLSSIDYTPSSGYIGTDLYTYTITKGGQTSAAITVNVTVKPQGSTDNISTTQDQLINKKVNTNDLTQIDPTVSGESIAVLGAASHGTAVLNGDLSSIDYTPSSGYIGTDLYTYTITKGGQTSAAITVNVTVKPQGSTDNISTTQDQLINKKVNTNDLTQIDPTVSGESIAVLGAASHGTAVLNGDLSSIDYTPSSGYIGTDLYTYTITKGGQTSAAITVNVTVKPQGSTDNISTTQDQLINKKVNTNDLTQIDPTVSGESIAVLGAASHGTAVLNGDLSSIDYTPSSGYIGTDLYTYTITKGGQTSAAITVNVTVKPQGSLDNDNTVQDQPVNTVVTGNDLTTIDPTISGQSIAVTTGAPNAVVNANGISIDYTPDPGFVGSAFYIYTITKNGQTSTGITVNIKVKPKGTDDNDATTQGLAKNTLVNNNDLTNTGVTIIPGPDPANGTLTLVGGNSITYAPNPTFVGVETYTYTLSKSGLTSAPITVTMTVKPKGTDDTDLTPLNTAVTTTVITNDGITGATVTPTNGGHGTTTVSGGDVTYTPATGYIGTDTYTYTLTQNGQISDPVTVTINVYNAAMSLTKVANNGVQNVGDVINYTLVVKNTGNVDITNVVVADAGADAGSITPASIATLAAGASATLTAKHTVGAADVAAGQYSNQASVTGKDPKNFTVTKPKSDDPGTSTPDDPTIVPISAPSGTISLTKAGAFAGNKVTYTFTIKNTGNTALNNITLTDAKLNLAAVSVTAPAGGLQPGASVTYSAVYTLTQADKNAGKVDNTASVSATDINNNPVTNTGTATTTVPKSPVAVDDKGDVTGTTPLVIPVLGNDDPGNSSFQLPSIEIITGPQHGTAVANTAGTITYTPTTGYVGPDVFTYRVKDQYGYYTNIATVTINAFAELVKIPTLFTPNGDGVNDGFVIKDLADYAQNELIVLNRWGNEVYRKENYQNNWSGTGLNEGTYFYIVKLKKANGDSWVIQKGYVTLIRQFKK